MNKDKLKDHLREKAANRKRYLFAIYSELINSKETTKIVLKEIQKDLAEVNLVTEADISIVQDILLKGNEKMFFNPNIIIVIEIDDLVWMKQIN